MQNKAVYNISVIPKKNKSQHTVDLANVAEKQAQKTDREEKIKISIFLRFKFWLENWLGDEEVPFLVAEPELKYEKKNFDYPHLERRKLKIDFRASFQQLYVFVLIKQLFSIVNRFFSLGKKMCFFVGWTAVFLLKFIYYSFFAFVGAVKNLSFFLFLQKKSQDNIWQKKYNFDEEKESLIGLSDYIAEKEKTGANTVKQKALELEKNRNFLTEQKIYTATTNRGVVSSERLSGVAGSKQRSWRLYFSWYFFKPALFFAIILFILVLPFKAMTYYYDLSKIQGSVLGASESALSGIKFAGKAAGKLDFDQAGEYFVAAGKSFNSARQEINSISGKLRILGALVPNDKLRLAADAEYILAAGEASTEIGAIISSALEPLSNSEEKNLAEIFGGFASRSEILKEKSQIFFTFMSKINADNLPKKYRNDFKLLQERSRIIDNSFSELYSLLENIKTFLGYYEDKSYLLVFQNNSEMRASGGFIGSFARVDFSAGKMTNIFFPPGGSYDTEGGLLKRIVAPKPLHIVNPLWHFWDANWWPDWKKSAKKLIWFYENSAGPSVDGVISFTPTAVENLLKIFGGVDMRENYGVYINSENFWEIIQTFSEEKPREHPAWQENNFLPKLGEGLSFSEQERMEKIISQATDGQEPKKIIADIFLKISEELKTRLDRGMFFGILQSLEDSLKKKQVLFYFNDSDLQRKAEEMNWAGRMKKTDFDYLQVVNTNISGAKSDRKIKQKIFHKADVQKDGSIINTVRVIRIHSGQKGEKFSGVRNLDWMRFYVPLGSELIEAKGFWPPERELFEEPDPEWISDADLIDGEENYIRDAISWTKTYNELGKTVFANWSQLDPGESIEVMIKYKLPLHISAVNFESNENSPYALMLAKQPGDVGSEFMSILNLPQELGLNWLYPSENNNRAHGWKLSGDFLVDKFWAIIINKD